MKRVCPKAEKLSLQNFAEEYQTLDFFFPEEHLHKFSESALSNFDKLVVHEEVSREDMTIAGLREALEILTDPLNGTTTAFIKQRFPKAWYRNW